MTIGNVAVVRSLPFKLLLKWCICIAVW